MKSKHVVIVELTCTFFCNARVTPLFYRRPLFTQKNISKNWTRAIYFLLDVKKIDSFLFKRKAMLMYAHCLLASFPGVFILCVYTFTHVFFFLVLGAQWQIEVWLLASLVFIIFAWITLGNSSIRTPVSCSLVIPPSGWNKSICPDFFHCTTVAVSLCRFN